ncbi:MAG: hypothetical protein H6815_04870 [Phycisphaeraceae bacterium]|nr:hypothetical protein [Phycisphaerales bacterium]MCB9859767.1 hypothetical protein [Phycisphaeraceae bacterium]
MRSKERRGQRVTARCASAVLIAYACVLASCAPEEHVVKYKPFFSGLEGAEHGTQPVSAGTGGGIPIEPKLAVETDELGHTTLNSPSISYLMSHVLRTLADEDVDRGRKIFVEQVVSETSRAELTAWGTSAEAQYDLMRAYYDDVYTLFSRLPMGEHSPNAIMSKTGSRRLRVEITGVGRKDLRWVSVQAERVGNEWRLVLPMQ